MSTDKFAWISNIPERYILFFYEVELFDKQIKIMSVTNVSDSSTECENPDYKCVGKIIRFIRKGIKSLEN
jgi:hypothetical protein